MTFGASGRTGRVPVSQMAKVSATSAVPNAPETRSAAVHTCAFPIGLPDSFTARIMELPRNGGVTSSGRAARNACSNALVFSSNLRSSELRLIFLRRDSGNGWPSSRAALMRKRVSQEFISSGGLHGCDARSFQRVGNRRRLHRFSRGTAPEFCRKDLARAEKKDFDVRACFAKSAGNVGHLKFIHIFQP